MVFARSALLLLSLSLLYSTVVYGEVTDSLPPIPSHYPAHPHNYPVSAPTPAPAPHHHHHAHPHNHPASAPTPAPAPHHHHHHPQAPAHAPVPHPAPSPKNTPKPPSPSPTHPTNRSLVAVQGVVYCKSSCKYAGHDTLYDSSALPNATVSLHCNNTKIPQAFKATTDKNGYFFLKAPRTITSFGAHKCKVSLTTSPSQVCHYPTPINGGAAGALLRPNTTFVADKLPFILYTVGPFAFEPQCKA